MVKAATGVFTLVCLSKDALLTPLEGSAILEVQAAELVRGAHFTE
jgi:hypothetical protein